MPKSILKQCINNTEEKINELKEKNPYSLPEELKGYTGGFDGIYAQYTSNNDYYLKLGRKDEKTFSFTWCERIKDGEFKSVSPIIIRKQSIIEDDEGRNNKLTKQGLKKGISKDKEEIGEFIDTVSTQLQETKGLDILKKQDAYVKVEDPVEDEDDTATDVPKTFEDYPPHIQKLAREVLSEDDLLKRICNTTSYRIGANETEIKLIVCGASGLYCGAGANILAGGVTGAGKTKIISEVLKNFPDNNIYYLNTSPKYIFRDAENLKGYKIIVANDIPLTLANIELIKSLTREEDVISYKTLEGDKNGKQTRLELELTGKYIVIMTFAKNTPDEELANPFFNLNIAPNDEEKAEIKGKIKEQNNMDTLHHKGYNLANEINKCAIQYLIDKDFTVFNPYSLFINPVNLNNRDINNVLNFIKGKTFFKYGKRRTINIKGKQVCLGAFEDLKEILDIWKSTEEVQKYKLDSIQEEILKILPTLSDEEAETEAKKYDENEEGNETFKNANRNAKRFIIETDIANESTKSLPLQHIEEKTSRGKSTVKNALYYESKNSNKPTLYSMGLVDYYDADIGSRYPQRMFYRKQKCSNSSKSNEHMNKKENDQYVDMLEVKQRVIMSLMIWLNILVNMYIEEKIFSYCDDDTSDITSYDGMCDFIEGFITEYEDDLQEFDSEHISLEELTYHNGILGEKNSLYNLDAFLVHMSKTTENAPNSNQNRKDLNNSDNVQKFNTKSEIGAISEKSSNPKSTENAPNSNQNRKDLNNSEKDNKNKGKSGIQSLLEKKKINDNLANEVIHIIGTDELTLYNIEQKLAVNRKVDELDDKIKANLEQLMNKLIKAGIVEEKLTTGAIYTLSNQAKLSLAIIREM